MLIKISIRFHISLVFYCKVVKVEKAVQRNENNGRKFVARTHKLIPSACNEGSRQNRVQSAIFATAIAKNDARLTGWLALAHILLTSTLSLTQTRTSIRMKEAKNTSNQRKGFTEKIDMGKVHINFIYEIWMNALLHQRKFDAQHY